MKPCQSMFSRLRYLSVSGHVRNIHLRRKCSQPCARSLADTWNPQPARRRRNLGMITRYLEMLDTATMPVAAQTRVGRPGDPCVMVIFGAAGDLTRRKLVPALYNLARNQLLSREFAILGIAHSSMSEEEFRKKVVEDVRQYTGHDGDPDLIEWFIRHMYYVTGEFEDKNIYPQLKSHLAKIDKEHSTHGNYFFYLATAPNFFGPIVEHLSAAV